MDSCSGLFSHERLWSLEGRGLKELVGHCPGDMAMRMRIVLALQQSWIYGASPCFSEFAVKLWIRSVMFALANNSALCRWLRHT